MSPVVSPEAAPAEPKASPAPPAGGKALSPIEQIRAAKQAKLAAGQAVPAKVQPKRSQLVKSVLHLMRRGHLYAGLLLLPWVFLYGITGFLFNHPEVWPDRPSTAITKAHTEGTGLANLPKARDIAAQVVAAINARGTDKYTLVDPEKIQFGRGGVSATLLGADQKTYTASFLSNGTGAIREGTGGRGGGGGGPQAAVPTTRPATPNGSDAGTAGDGMPGRREGMGREGMGRGRRMVASGSADLDGPVSAVNDLSSPDEAVAPRGEGRRGRGRRGGEGNEAGGFAGEGRPQGRGVFEGRAPEGRGGEGRVAEGRGGFGGPGLETEVAPAPFAVTAGLSLDPSPLSLVESSLPTVLERVGMTGATVSAVRMTPLSFTIENNGTKWLASYNAETGAVTGREVTPAAEGTALSFRRFLLRMHTAHGYPAEDMNMRWIWAVIVDATSLVMVFWGISGIVMWWQIKRTRWLGGACLLLSTAAAVYIGIGMHELIAAGGR